QIPAAARHVVPPAKKPSGGQLLLTPLQLSARSQIPADARQTAVLLMSFGHAALDPVQVSATSQTPAAARHMVPAATKPSVGQVLLTPLRLPGPPQSPAGGRPAAGR